MFWRANYLIQPRTLISIDGGIAKDRVEFVLLSQKVSKLLIFLH